ncbi:membrane protein insertion efficiency factor YidD [Helicobacter muridarum]|nr:membrane protein insertion efficiency factor YidD [Helicobacter muridarum]STQ86183.1 Protein YidD [Helicobacter muridarum]
MRRLMYLFVLFYKRFVSPFLPPACRYYPTCSIYALILLRFDNPVFAVCKIVCRILYCNPLSKGGFNPAFVFLPINKQKNIQKLIFIASFKQAHFLSPICPQIPQNANYFFIESNMRLLRRFQKFYIISVYV